MRPLTRRQQRAALFLLPVVALGAAAILWFTLRGDRAPGPEDAARASADAVERARRAVDPVAYVALRSDVTQARNLDDLVQAYGVWVGRKDALSARRNIVHALLAHKDPLVGLQGLLIAVDRDPTPRASDPLWNDLVRKVGGLWNGVTLNQARDQALIETRPRPRDLLIESLAEIAPERLADHQRPLLAAELIDLFPTLSPEQKPAFNRALQALAGSDVVEILAGRALGEGQPLQAATERKQVLEEIRRKPVRERPAEE